MTEPTNEGQTPSQQAGDVSSANVSSQQQPTQPQLQPSQEPPKSGVQFTAEQQEFLNKLVSDARREGRESEKKKYADYAELQAAKKKLDEVEKAKLSAEEKKKLELETLQKQIDAKEAELNKILLLNKKRTALDNAKLTLPKEVTVNELLEMMPGESDEDIEASIQRFKKMFPENKSLGGPSQTPQQQPQKPPDLVEQIAILEKKAMDPTISHMDRAKVEDQLMKLKLQAGGLIAIQPQVT